MKKTININLGGQPFIIDEQAYDILHRYFEALKAKFTNENERKEILSDIEDRVAEIFTQRLAKTRAVVNEEDVIYIISLLGRPEDIAGEPEPSTSGTETKSASNSYSTYGPAEKKLFRDPDNKRVGGVIAGLCYYFGWGDPTWIRIATLALVVLSMFAGWHLGFPIVVIYLILRVVIPEANTSAEKLQMRGQPVTIQNIEKEVRDAMSTAGSSINSFIKTNNAAGRLSSAGMMILRAFARIVLVFVVLICVLLMIALAGSFFGLSILSSASLSEITHLLVANRYTIMLFNVGLLLAIGIPLVSIMYDSIRFLTNSQVKNPLLRRTLWVFWFIGIVILAISSWTVFGSFASSDTTTQKVQLLAPRTGTLNVQLADTLGHALEVENSDDKEISAFIHIDGLARTPYGFSFSDLKIEVAVSPDSNFYVERVFFSRGANYADAARNIEMMHYKFSQTDTTLNLDNKFELPANGKWRRQRMKIRIYVPEGKQISFANNVDQVETSVKGNDYFDDGMLTGHTLKVEGGKIKCQNCKEKIIEEDKDASDDTNEDTTSGKKHVEIHMGDKKSDQNLKNVSVNINQSGISVTGKNDKNEKVKVKVDDQGLRVIKTDTNGNTKITQNTK